MPNNNMGSEEKKDPRMLGQLSPAGATFAGPVRRKPFDVLDPGHCYVVYRPGDEADGYVLQFLKKVPVPAEEKVSRPGELKVEQNGLTNETVIEVLISRMHYLQSMNPCYENEEAIAALKVALNSLERRTRARQSRGVEGTDRA